MPDNIDIGFAAKLPPREAIAFFEQKGYATSWDWWEVWESAHARAFTVAKAVQTDVLQSIRGALDKALAEGQTHKQFASELEPRLQKLGWWGQRIVVDPDGGAERVQLGSPHRLQTIFDSNMRSTFGAARQRQQMVNIKSRPFWLYDARNDSRVRPSHAAMDGMVFPANDPIWGSHYPPNGWNCRCRVRALTAEQVRSRGLRVRNSEGALEEVEQEVGVDRRTGEVISQQPDGLARVAQGEDEEPCPPVLAGVRVTDHRSLPVVDLCFFTRGGGDHRPSLDGGLLPDGRDEAPHAGIAGREAVVVDQVLPDGHGVAPAGERLDDQLAVGLARARLRRSTGPLRGNRCGLVRALASHRGRRRIGGHLRRNGRICRTSARAATTAHGQAGRLQVAAGGLAPDPGGLFNPPQRPAEASQREDLLSFLFAQDVAHAGQERRVPDRRQRLGPLSEMAGFQPSTNGRIWVSTEGIGALWPSSGRFGSFSTSTTPPPARSCGRNRPKRSWRASPASRNGRSRRTADKRFMNH